MVIMGTGMDEEQLANIMDRMYSVRCSVKCGIEGMKKYLQENF